MQMRLGLDPSNAAWPPPFECGLAATLAESLGLSGAVGNSRGYAAAEAEPQTLKLPPGKPEAFRKDSGQAAS